MINLIFEETNETISVNFKRIANNLVKLEGDFTPLKNGFKLFTSDNRFLGDYLEFTTIYKQDDNCVIYSNDGSVYVAPIEPEIVVPEETELEDATPEEEVQLLTLEQRIETCEECLLELSEVLYTM